MFSPEGATLFPLWDFSLHIESIEPYTVSIEPMETTCQQLMDLLQNKCGENEERLEQRT